MRPCQTGPAYPTRSATFKMRECTKYCVEGAKGPKERLYCSPDMPRRFGLPRIFAWAAVTAVLLGSPGFALAETVYADFDRDGQTDVLSTSSGSRFSLQVWLSS